MPTYRVTDPQTGRTIRLTGDSPPTEQELNQIFSKVNIPNRTGNIPTPQTQKQDEVERGIAQRPDLFAQGAEQAFGQPSFDPRMVGTFGVRPNVPLGILQSIGGLAQRGEAAIANPIIEAGKPGATPGKILRSIGQGVTGQRLGELGDVPRQWGLPEPVAAGMGLVGSGVLTGGMAKALNLTKKADNLIKIQTQYGEDIARNIIRQATELPMPLVERGMKRGWRKILTKSNARNAELPTQISGRVLDSLDDISEQQYRDYGAVVDRITSGSVRGADLENQVNEVLVRTGYLDVTGTETIKPRGTILNFIEKIRDSGVTKIKPDDNVPISVINHIKDKVKGFLPKDYLYGKSRSLTDEQRVAKTLYMKLNDLISTNAYGIEDEAFIQAKKQYRQFKNYEKLILDTFSKTVGQETKATANKVVGLGKLQPTRLIEEMNKLYAIDEFLVNRGKAGFADSLLDWITTQGMLIKPEGGIFREFVRGPVKYLNRQYLRSGAGELVGGRTGRAVNQANVIPASILQGMRKQSE